MNLSPLFTRLLLILLFFPQAVAADPFKAGDEPEAVILRGLWRSGEMIRYELNETVRIYHQEQLIETRENSSLVHIDVAAHTPGQRYVLIWQLRETNASLFDDPVLDRHMHSLIADGLVIETDGFGGIRQSTNIDELFAHFQLAVAELDGARHWDGRSDIREQLDLYLRDPALFEALLMRDIRFIFGLHGVEVRFDAEFTYDTWQENPWGEPAASQGRLFITGYDEQSRLLTVVNQVSLKPELKSGTLVLREEQTYQIAAGTGWPQEVRLFDEMGDGEFRRVRELHVTRVPF
ncbi:hypothetical protein [Cyclonatronum proteinivorum]|uniref:hypothetical protein n=1 Tax=Cyclonatronum proteinivorum TaxID=1457365 RepID=UPI000E0F60CD|nr:hypothetical protein [Cyclonatronum proteinivorum]